MQRPRSLRLLAVLGVLFGLLTPLRGQAATGCVHADLGDSWQRWTAPPDLTQDLRALAVSPQDAGRVWVTDGAQVLRTVDAGCEWRVAYVPSSGVFVSVNSTEGRDGITQVLVNGAPGQETTWVVDQGVSVSGAHRAQVFVATGGGDGFTQSVGLPGTGDVVLAVGSVPSRAYAVVTTYENLITTGDDLQSVVSTLWVTSDTGGTWKRVGDLPDGFSPRGAAVTPRGDYLTWSDHQLLRSTDGGVPQVVPVGADPIAAVSVARSVVVVPEKGQAQVSADGGAAFTASPIPASTRVVAKVPGIIGYGLVVGTRSPQVDLWAPGLSPFDVTPRKTPLVGVVGGRDGGGTPVLVGFGTKDVMVLPLTLTGRPVTPPKPLPPIDVKVTTPGVRAPPVSALVPASTTLTLKPGERRRVDYRLQLPPVPGPLDVYFLMDTTGSMQPSIDGLRQSIQDIVDSLAASRLDVQMGLGDFRDVDEALSKHVYVRDARLAPPGEALARGLERLSVGGGGDGPEADTIGLVEAVTGKGRIDGTVPPGQDAGFRVDSTQVVVLVTDAPMHVEAPVYPTFAEVKDALGPVRVLGISVGSDGLADLKRVARDTHGTAPVEGLDCDGDGTYEVAAGAAAVCQIGEGGFGGQQLGPAIISLLQSVAQPGRVTVTATGSAVAGVAGDLDEVLDLARPQRIGFAVDFACGREDAGKLLTADLTASASGRRVIGSVAKVRCAGLPVPPRPPAPQAPAPPAPAQVAAVLVPPAAPPAPAQAPQAQPLTNPQPGTVTNPNVMAAAVDQHQQQVELALAQQEIESLEELATVGRPGPDDASAALRVLAAAAVFASVCGGVRLRSRRSAKRSLVRVRA